MPKQSKTLSVNEIKARDLETRFLARLLKYVYSKELSLNRPGVYRTVTFNTSPGQYDSLVTAIEKKLGSAKDNYDIPTSRSIRNLIIDNKPIKDSYYDALHIYVHDSYRQTFLNWLDFLNYYLLLDKLDDRKCEQLLQSFDEFKRLQSASPSPLPEKNDSPFYLSENLRRSEQSTLFIDRPANNEVVQQTPVATGRILVDVKEIWLVVKPINTINHFVQHKAFIEQDGHWIAQIYIGSQGEGDIGHRFEVRAIANPRSILYPEQLLPRWPESEFQSNIIEVVRG